MILIRHRCDTAYPLIWTGPWEGEHSDMVRRQEYTGIAELKGLKELLNHSPI